LVKKEDESEKNKPHHEKLHEKGTKNSKRLEK
jgi:hypothetical protein